MPPAEVKNAVVVTPALHNPAELLWNLIIRPPRSKYTTAQLGPEHFRVGKCTFVRRTDTQIENARGHTLQCSLFEPLPQTDWERSRAASSSASQDTESKAAGNGHVNHTASAKSTPQAEAHVNSPKPIPCVIFLHGNSSCRLEALPLVTLLMPLCISLFCFDFSGCGLSEGDYISLGWFERDDLAICVDYLRSIGRVSTIALWGRSMGAFTALLHADRDPTIAGLVLDSPFVSLKELAQELASSYAKVPAWMVNAVLTVVRSIIQSKAHFDIESLEAIEHVSRSFSPALFIAAQNDDFILPRHTRKLYEAYQGEKDLQMVQGDHNSARPEACRRTAALFLCRTFHCPRLSRLLEMHTSGLYDVFAGPPQFPDTTEAIDSSEDGAALCQQMQMFPALRQMRLVHERRCRRPFVARTIVKLQQESSEAGFFVRLEPAVTSVDSKNAPRFLVLTVSVQALIISQVCDDDLETLVASAGLPAKQARHLAVGMTKAGELNLQLGEDEPLSVACGVGYREEVTIWIMLLHGQSSFGPFTVEDGEATLRENLGDVVVRQRHLGPLHGTQGTSSPTPLPRGEFNELQPSAPTSNPLESAPLAPSTRAPELSPACGPVTATQDRISPVHADIMRECANHPEALVGWRVKIHSLGEGLVIGVRRRRGRTTQHLISNTSDVCSSGKPSTVILCRKESHVRWRRGLKFELLRREF